MQLERIGFVGVVAGVLLGGLVAGAGCGGPEDDVSGTSGASELRGGFSFHRRHPPGTDGGAVGGNLGGGSGGGAGPVGSGGTGSAGSSPTDDGASTDCDICTQAQACCQAVQEAGTCSFSAVTCSSMTGAARPAYVNACLTQVVSVRGAWSGNPPAECR